MNWWAWAFDGVGGAVGLALAGYVVHRLWPGRNSDGAGGQSIEAGHNSINLQAGRDIGKADSDING